MSDRPSSTPPGEPELRRPDEVTPPPADETAALPQPASAVPGGDDTAQLPPRPASAGPGYPPPPPAAPAWPGGQAPAAASAAAASAPPRGPRRWWGEATSSDGGRAALIAVAVLGALLLVTGIGLVAAVASHGAWGRDERVGMGREWGPGNGMGNGLGKGRGQDRGDDRGYGPGMGNRNRGQAVPDDDLDGMGNGMGMGRGGMLGAGGALHGEFTTSVTGTPTVMVFQTGQVSAYTAGKSITVRSADGFEGTYVLDANTTATTRRAGLLATGSQVSVLAAKEGMKVTRLAVVG